MPVGVRACEPEVGRNESLGTPEHGDRLPDEGRIRNPGGPDAVAGPELDRLAGKTSRLGLETGRPRAGPAARGEREAGQPSEDRQRTCGEEGGTSDPGVLSTAPGSRARLRCSIICSAHCG